MRKQRTINDPVKVHDLQPTLMQQLDDLNVQYGMNGIEDLATEAQAVASMQATGKQLAGRHRLDADIYRDVVTTFSELYQWRDKFLEGHYDLLVIIGGKGLSKSFMFELALSKNDFLADFERLQEGDLSGAASNAQGNESSASGDESFLPVKVPTPAALRSYPYLNSVAAMIGSVATPVEVYKKLFHYRNKPLVIDDVDKLLKRAEMISMLKAVCQKQKCGRAFVQWNKQNTVMASEGIPSSFVTTSKVCIIGNKLHGVDHDLDALLSRGKVIEFDPSIQEVHRYIGTWWDGHHSDVYDWIGERLALMPSPSIRWYTEAVKDKNAGWDWREKVTKLWTSQDPLMPHFVRVWNDKTLATDAARAKRFIEITKTSKRTYDRVKARFKLIHGMKGRRRGRKAATVGS